MRQTGVLGFTVSFFRDSFPWNIHKLVSDSPHGLDIFFCCYLPQFLADIPDDTEYSAAYIHRFLLPDCPIDLLFRENSSWLTGKVRQGVKFIILCQRNFLPLIRCLVAERVNTESGILKNRISIQQCLAAIQPCQDLFLHQTGTFCRAKYQFNHTCFVPPSPSPEMLRLFLYHHVPPFFPYAVLRFSAEIFRAAVRCFFLLQWANRKLLNIHFNITGKIFTFDTNVITATWQCNCFIVCSVCFN